MREPLSIFKGRVTFRPGLLMSPTRCFKPVDIVIHAARNKPADRGGGGRKPRNADSTIPHSVMPAGLRSHPSGETMPSTQIKITH